jgi:cell division protein FtsW (lipid II flippase)
MSEAVRLPAPDARRQETMLLAGAALVTVGAFAAVDLGHSGSLSGSVASYGLTFTAMWGVARLAVRWLVPAADPLLLPLVATLNGLGLAVIYRLDLAGADRAHRLGHPVPRSAAHLQLVWTGLSIIVFVAVLLIARDHRTLARYTYTAGLVAFGLLLLPAVPGIGTTINGARLWLRLGPFTFQPSEAAKIVILVFFAGYLTSKRDVLALTYRSVLGLSVPRGRDLGPLVVAWLLSLGVLVVESDVGSSLLFFGMFLVLLYVATQRVSWLLIGLSMFAAGAILGNMMIAHVHERVDIWLHAFAGTRPENSSYQLVQGLYGFAAGGITGTGLSRGQPNTVPFANTDFIMASIGEELGLVGVMAILTVYALIVGRGLRTALTVRDPFGKLLATGLAFSLALQVFIQVGGVMRLIPLSGMTLPFISYGGSSLLANTGLIALLLRISDAARRAPVSQPAAPLYDPAAVADSPTQIVPR